jgi:hypothetical protein
MTLFGTDATKDYSGGKKSIPKGTKKDSKLMVAPSEKEVSENVSAIMHEGVMKHPVVESATYRSADYYRRGGPFKSKTNTAKNGQGDVPKPGFSQDPGPRQLGDPAEDSIGTIRLIGKPNRNQKAAPIDLIPPYSKFFLEAVQEGHSERSQVVETFGDFFVFFYGERPAVYNFSGTLLNADNINWAEDFFFYYDNFLRGTKCVEAGAVLTITYGFRQIEGFLMSMNTATQAISERGVSLSFQVLVTDRKYLKLSNDFGLLELPVNDATGRSKFVVDTTLLSMLQTGTSKGINMEGANKVSKVNNKKEESIKQKGLDNSDMNSTLNSFPNAKGKIAPDPGTSKIKVSNLA